MLETPKPKGSGGKGKKKKKKAKKKAKRSPEITDSVMIHAGVKLRLSCFHG